MNYWQKQAKPLFPELEWNKPERRDQAGRLLVIGGNVHNLNAPAKAFETVKKFGIGDVRVALPDKTRKLVTDVLPEAIFLPSTLSGEFSSKAEHELLEYAQWADTLLLPGNFGRNSQVSILLETLLDSYTGQVVMSCDGIDNTVGMGMKLLARENTTLVLSFAQLQKLAKPLPLSYPVVFNMDLVKLVTVLHEITSERPAAILTLHNNQILAAVNGRVSTTKYDISDTPLKWRVKAASIAACFQTWNPGQPFEALTHSSSLVLQ